MVGTKWCGRGNTAKDLNDLGDERDTDACCRAHDHCPDFIDKGLSKYGLTNHALYTRYVRRGREHWSQHVTFTFYECSCCADYLVCATEHSINVWWITWLNTIRVHLVTWVTYSLIFWIRSATPKTSRSSGARNTIPSRSPLFWLYLLKYS